MNMMNGCWKTEAAVLGAGTKQGSEEVVGAVGAAGAAEEILTSAATIFVKIKKESKV